MKNLLNLSLTVEKEILLRPLREEESSSLFELVDANREHLKEFMGWLDYSTTPADSLVFIRGEQEKLERLQTITLGIYFLDQLVGVLSLYHIDPLNQYASIGYWIGKAHQGEGIVSKSTHTLIQYAFKELQLHRIEIRCALHNHRSQKIAEKLGFSKEGILKEAIAHYGMYFDAYIYGLLNRPLA